MDRVKVEHIQVKDCDLANCIDVELYYRLGGFNCFTYEQEPRGYVVSASPVKRSGCTTIYEGFSGVKKLVYPCARKGKKSEVEALKLYEETKKQLVEYLITKHSLELV